MPCLQGTPANIPRNLTCQKLQLLRYIFALIVWVCLHSNFHDGLQNTCILKQSAKWQFKVIDFNYNRKHVCNCILVINSNLGHVLPHLRDCRFSAENRDPTPIPPEFWGCFVDVVAPNCEDPKLVIHVINFELNQPIRPLYRVRQKKVIPCRNLQIFKQPLWIFWWNFAVIFSVHSDIQLPNIV